MDDPSFPGKKVFDYKSDYPQRFTARGGPVPLIPGSRLVPLLSYPCQVLRRQAGRIQLEVQ